MPDLSPHLHTDECNAIAADFIRCNAEHPYSKWIGKCDNLMAKMDMCFKKERRARAANNHKISNERRAETFRRIREYKKRLAEKGEEERATSSTFQRSF